MKQSGFRKKIKILFLSLKTQFIIDLQYRLNFLFSFLGTTAWLIGELLFTKFLLERYNAIAGWNIYQIGLLLGVNQIWVGAIFFFVISPSLHSFADRIKFGAIDKILTMPVNTRFYISTYKYNWTSITIFVEGLILVIYCLNKLSISISFLQVIIFIFFLVLSSWIMYCVQYIGMSLIFWLKESETIMYLPGAIDRLSRYPYEIYSKGVIFFLFTFIFPATLVSNVPARVLLNILDLEFAIYAIVTAVWLYVLSHILWKAGLKRYEGGSS